jgi:hypothetical protein
MTEGVRHWRKSSRSGVENCVEVASWDTNVFVRDSKDPAGAELTFPVDSWRDFVEAVKDHEFDRRGGSEPR